MLVLCMLMKVTLLCGRHCRVKHTECHREPFFSQVSVTQEEGSALASFENSLLCRNSVHSQKVYDSFGAMCSVPKERSKSMYRNNLIGASVI